ncbi:forkhead box protein K1-like [Anopheles stephensi]|uniref:forkhead box protein K1-like n=1 Tax=Anopheles stephensi TaxID=30069 RepID=UPI001658A6C2|nr:forkhead box protein K1-like [Anopheles stephensi]
MERMPQTTQTTESAPDPDVSMQETASRAIQQYSPDIIQCTTIGNADGNDLVILPSALNFIGRLVGKDHLLLISEPKAVVGRAVPGNSVDFPVSESKLISRQHFLIQYCNDEFSVVCLSKNGVYMGERFLRKSNTAYKLEASCYFRFPSTNITVFFDNLIGSTANVGLVVNRDTIPSSVTTLLYRAPEGSQSDATAGNNYEYTESAHSIHAISSQLQETFNKLLGPAPASIPSAEQIGVSFEAASASQENTTSTLPVNNGQQLTGTPPSRFRAKPSFSYSQLIIQAIRASPAQQLTLSEIYSYLMETYPYFRARSGGGWQNSIRHNLSLNRFFIKIPRTTHAAGKGNYWRIDHKIYSKVMANRYQKPKRRSATMAYAGASGGTYRSAPVSPNYDYHSRPDSPMNMQGSMSVPGSPEHMLDGDL